MQDVNFAVVGIANFARSHIEFLRRLERKDCGIRLWGVVAKYPKEDPKLVEELRGQGRVILGDFEELLEVGKDEVDVITLPTSIPSHAPLSIAAMKAGYDVLCEKPPAATIQDIDAMIEATQQTGRFCAIGFQHMFAPSIQGLKEMLLDGRIGKLRELACHAYWPRTRSYYERNRWAGKVKVDGHYVLDGPMNNALAHYLQNMLYLAGKSQDEAAMPQTIQAELYRGHSYIEGEDTSCTRILCANGTSIHFYVTHCSEQNEGPVMEVLTDKAKVTWVPGRGVIEFTDDRQQVVEDGHVDCHLEVFCNVAQVIRGERERPFGHVENTRSFVLCVNGAYLSSVRVWPIPEEYVREYEDEKGELRTVVEDIREIGEKAFQERKLFSEISVPWARKTEAVSLDGIKEFSLDWA